MFELQVNNEEDKVCTISSIKPPPRWKYPRRFKLRLEPHWESSNSEEDSEMEMDELLLMASQCYEEQDKTQNGIADNHNTHCILKETKLNMLKHPSLRVKKTVGKLQLQKSMNCLSCRNRRLFY